MLIGLQRSTCGKTPLPSSALDDLARDWMNRPCAVPGGPEGPFLAACLWREKGFGQTVTLRLDGTGGMSGTNWRTCGWEVRIAAIRLAALPAAATVSNGSPVRFAVMCPATQFWQDRVYDITMQLYRKYGVRGVYIDQIAAASARLCFDPSHGHPLGGGHWWADGYRRMLDRVRRDMPQGAFLTTECNAEAFIPQFDAYLTWHW